MKDVLEEFLEQRKRAGHAKSKIEETRSKELDPLLAHTGRGKEMPWQLPEVREFWLGLLARALEDPYHEGLALFAMRKVIHNERVMGRYAALADVMYEDDLYRGWEVVVQPGSSEYSFDYFAVDTTTLSHNEVEKENE